MADGNAESLEARIEEDTIVTGALEFSGSIPTPVGSFPRQFLFVDSLPTGYDINTNAVYFTPNSSIVPDFTQYATGSYSENGQTYNRVAVTKSKTVDGLYHLLVFYTSNNKTYGTPDTLLANPLPYITFDYLVGGPNIWTRYRDTDGNTSWNDRNWTERLEVSNQTTSGIYTNMLYGTIYFSFSGKTANVHWDPAKNTIDTHGVPLSEGLIYKYNTYYYYNGSWVNLGDSDFYQFIANSIPSLTYEVVT